MTWGGLFPGIPPGAWPNVRTSGSREERCEERSTVVQRAVRPVPCYVCDAVDEHELRSGVPLCRACLKRDIEP